MKVSGDYNSSGTGLAKLGPMLVASLAFSLVPSNNFDIPHSLSSFGYGDYTEMNPSITFAIENRDHEIEQLEILVSFATELSCNVKDLEPEIAKLLSKNLWDIYDRF
jgi:hypothetical protein